ncbi:DUF4129 domain-containing protein [Streptomyces sp. NPDC046984]|uniref:DUF4129 domain-containing protein n=1 Tax=Streptomyces sp. NPDC046984 TaxID=3155138 RepID=UPI0033F2114B
MLALIAVAILGVGAQQDASLSAARHRLGHSTWITAVVSVGGLLVSAAGLAVVLLAAWRISRRLRRKRDTDQPPHVVEQPTGGLVARLVALVTVLLVMGAAVGAVLLGAHLRALSGGSPPRPPHSTHPPVSTTTPAVRHGAPSPPGLLWLLVTGLLVLTLVAVLLTVARLRRAARPGTASGQAIPTGRLHPPAAHPPLGTDPRSAVIAQYLELELELARAQIPRKPFETPTELLERAAYSGLPTSSARRLAQLFTTARYSSRPVTDEQQVQAEQSLTAVRRQWALQRATVPTSPGGESS